MPSRLPVSLQPGIHSYRRSWICRYRQQPDHQWHSRRKTMYRGYNRKTIMNAVYFDVWNLSCSLHDRLLRGLSNTGKQSRTISLCRLESHNQSQKLFFALSRKLRKKKERKWCISFLLLLHNTERSNSSSRWFVNEIVKLLFILFLLLSKDLNFLVHFHRHETPMIGRILLDEIERRANVWFPRKSIFFAHHVYRRIQHPFEYMASPDVPLGFKGVWK